FRSGRRRLPGPLQPHQQDHCRPDRRRLEPFALLTEQRDQLVVDDLDDLLPRRHGLEHLLAERTCLDLREEIAGQLIVHVRLEQHAPDLPEPLPEPGLREQAARLEPAQYAVELFRKFVEHGVRGPAAGNPKPLSIRNSRPFLNPRRPPPLPRAQGVGLRAWVAPAPRLPPGSGRRARGLGGPTPYALTPTP